MELALPTAVAVVVVVLLSWRMHRRRRRREADRTVHATAPASATVVLDIGDADPASESVRRLVREVGARALARSPEFGEISVVARSGKPLGRVTAKVPAPRETSPPPMWLVEPHTMRRTIEPPDGLEDELRPTVTPRFDAHEHPAPRRPLADSFDLPASVRRRIRDPDDPVDVVRAILEAGGLRADVSEDVVRAGDDAFVVVPLRAALPAALTHAYFRFMASGASAGIVLTFRFVDPAEIRRRELFAPELRHAGAEAIQRMADAVSVGANPVAFALRPPVVRAAASGGNGHRKIHRLDREAG